MNKDIFHDCQNMTIAKFFEKMAENAGIGNKNVGIRVQNTGIGVENAGIGTAQFFRFGFLLWQL